MISGVRILREGSDAGNTGVLKEYIGELIAGLLDALQVSKHCYC